jgi:hypothetical protein
MFRWTALGTATTFGVRRLLRARVDTHYWGFDVCGDITVGGTIDLLISKYLTSAMEISFTEEIRMQI